MKPYQSLKLQTLAIVTIFVVLSLIGSAFLPALPVVTILAALAVTGLCWRLFRALQHQFDQQLLGHFRQLEALSGLYGSLGIRQPLPRSRYYAASPDFLHLVASEILRRKPALIVEAGSGTSTLIAAYCLQKIGAGKIVSFDHDEKYAEITRRQLADHQLQQWAEVNYAPLTEHSYRDRGLTWYDLGGVNLEGNIDLMVVDGPPMTGSAHARYPAVPLLRDRLHADSVILLDDGSRKAETETVAMWRDEFGLEYQAEPMEKGAYRCEFADKT